MSIADHGISDIVGVCPAHNASFRGLIHRALLQCGHVAGNSSPGWISPLFGPHMWLQLGR